ncbi:Ubiquitin-associated domain [Arabidopsis thaliana x Arabidopsis arenosa]|uniref:Ubiquitin-associated domain n=1 Tax=Arabidopsis thaliana x Arabidopsis arenosa TaxID=1240361 RepID=A0A8T2AXP9_9BRAS|nr:Ubiquitin-associated domain [Arabidopsis thaliana x Arabidopsis arenosa]
MAKLKVAGTWGGIIEVELENWTLHMLRDEVAKRSGLDPESIKLIFAGKILKDDGDATLTLAQLGIKENSKILSSRGTAPEEGKSIMAEEERSRRLSRVKAAATALSKRHADGSLPIQDYNIELEDQGGHKVQFGTETDQSAVMMGLMLHTKAKSLIEMEMYSDAVEVLAMAEESFLLCDPKILELVDNLPMMEIDIVWCYFLLRDVKCLSDAGVRLERARKGLERAHGKDLSRVRLLQAGQSPEMALYLRLELLEGVVAYHTGQYDKALNALKSAHAKFLQLQIPDETLSLVMGMGFQEKDAKRALRLNNQDIASSVDFLIEERAKRAQKREQDLQRQQEILEQKNYGVTPMKKAVDMQMLERLVSIGYARDLAAESLRRNENDIQKALDILTDPKVNSTIQAYIESRKRKRQEQLVGISVDELVSMGFERGRATSALEAGGNREDIIQRLLLSASEANQGTTSAINATSSTNNGGAESSGFGGRESTSNEIDGGAEQDSEMKDETMDDIANREGTSSDVREEERDSEIEDEIADEIAKVDALSAYDINLDKEIEAINEYLAMLDASQESG